MSSDQQEDYYGFEIRDKSIKDNYDNLEKKMIFKMVYYCEKGIRKDSKWKLFLSLFLKFFIILCLRVKFCERTPAVHLQDIAFLRDVASSECADLRIHVVPQLPVGQHSGTAIISDAEEVREQTGEVPLQGGEPIEDARCFFIREPDEAGPVKDAGHIMQKFLLLRLEIALVQIIQCEEIFEADVLEVRSHGAVESDTWQLDWIGREITEPIHVSDCLRDLKCGDWEHLFS